MALWFYILHMGHGSGAFNRSGGSPHELGVLLVLCGPTVKVQSMTIAGPSPSDLERLA